MSFPNPDNYAKDCECPIGSSIPAPSAIQNQLTNLELKVEQAAYKDIPAPVIHIDSNVSPRLYVSYIPSHSTAYWLTTGTEVWLFYRKKYDNYRRKERYGHPRDTSKPIRSDRYYGGSGAGQLGYTCRTEFSFLKNGQLPAPYEQVPLTGFDPIHFYRFYDAGLNITRQLLLTDFPILGTLNSDKNVYAFRKWRFPVYRAGTSKSAYKTDIRFQFRFAIPNPNYATTGIPKLFGPPSNVVHCNLTKTGDSQKNGNSASVIGFSLKQ